MTELSKQIIGTSIQPNETKTVSWDGSYVLGVLNSGLALFRQNSYNTLINFSGLTVTNTANYKYTIKNTSSSGIAVFFIGSTPIKIE